MQLDIPDNPNCPGSEQFVFQELAAARPVKSIRVGDGPSEEICDVTGVEDGGSFVPATAVKITDSSDGHAFLIRGGQWGIRLRPAGGGEWDLDDPDQWGEPFKIYGSEADIIYQ